MKASMAAKLGQLDTRLVELDALLSGEDYDAFITEA